jgi:phage virion morphogenesis protein
MVTINVEVEDADVKAWFGRLIDLGQDLRPVLADFGEILIESTQRRFAEGKAPDGTAWAPLKSRQGSPLLDTGTMRDQIASEVGPDFVQIVASAKQASWHQFGTDPFVILPKSRQALAWPGGPGPRKRVNHPGLPPRPFLGLSDEDRAQMDAVVRAYLTP